MALLEDKQSLGREDCNVPIFGFQCSTDKAGFSRSKMRIIVGSGDLGELYDAFKSPITIIHRWDHLRTACLGFHCIPTISVNWENY